MSKILEKVSTIESPEALKKDLGMEHSSEAGDEDWENATDALKNLSQAAAGIRSGANGTQNSNMSMLSTSASKAGVSWDFWTWLTSSLDAALNWTVEAVKEGWAFIVKTAKGVYNFILKTVTHVAQAVHKVFEAIRVGISKLIEWVGFLFNWDDIVDTKNVLVNLTTGGMLFSDDFKKTKVGKNAANEHSKKQDDKFQKEMDSPGSNYGSYHIKHGRASIPLSGRKPGQTAGQRTMESLDDIFEKLKALMSSIGSNIAKLFQKSDKSIGELLTEMGLDLLLKSLDLIQSLVVALIKALADLILKIADDMNSAVQIPVLSTLYRKISGGTDLTILDAVCLVIAIPVTVIYKIVKNEPLSKTPGIGPLLKPNIYKAAIDKRRGILTPTDSISRKNTDSFSMKSSGSKIKQTPSPIFETTVVQALSPFHTLIATNSFGSTNGVRESNDKTKDSSTTDYRKPVAGQEVWEDDINVVNVLKQIAPPIISAFMFHVFTVPDWSIPDIDIDNDFSPGAFVEGAALKKEVKHNFKKTAKFLGFCMLLWLQKPGQSDAHRALPGWSLRIVEITLVIVAVQRCSS